jgi:hypothetical protein
MAAEWFYSHGGNMVGPLTAAQLRQHALALWVVPEDHVRRGIEGEWMPAAKVKGLFDPPPEPAAPPQQSAQTEPAGSKAVERPTPAKRLVTAELAAPYDYKMVEVAPRLAFDKGEKTKGRLAAYLEEIVNQHASQGWEFYRVDSMSKTIHPGCLGALFGERSRAIMYYVVTFRRPH